MKLVSVFLVNYTWTNCYICFADDRCPRIVSYSTIVTYLCFSFPVFDEVFFQSGTCGRDEDETCGSAA